MGTAFLGVGWERLTAYCVRKTKSHIAVKVLLEIPIPRNELNK